MNPAMGLIVIILCIAVWFLMSKLYKPIGGLIYKIGKNAINELKNKDDKE